jgi:hypothetical protein
MSNHGTHGTHESRDEKEKRGEIGKGMFGKGMKTGTGVFHFPVPLPNIPPPTPPPIPLAQTRSHSSDPDSLDEKLSVIPFVSSVCSVVQKLCILMTIGGKFFETINTWNHT